MKIVRWGLISTAHINRRLIPAIRAAQRGELVAVASRSKEKAESYAREWEIPQAFSSYEALLESGAVDAVYIGLPNHMHAEWSVRALRAGIHVLCEKPFALTVQEVDRMITASRETGSVLADAFMYRHHPQTKIAGELAHSGRLGEIAMVRSAFGYVIGDRDNVRLNPKFGGGCLWDVGVYPLTFAQYVFGGPPERVSGEMWLGESGVDEFFSGQLFFTGGGLAHISASFRTPFETYAEVIGTQGRLSLNRPFIGMEAEGQLVFHPANGDPEIVPVPQKELYAGEVEDMHAAILDGKPNYLLLQESRDYVGTVQALYHAARTRRVLRPQDTQHFTTY